MRAEITNMRQRISWRVLKNQPPRRPQRCLFAVGSVVHSGEFHKGDNDGLMVFYSETTKSHYKWDSVGFWTPIPKAPELKI